MKGAVSESRGSVWKKAKTEKQLEVLWFFPTFREIIYTFSKNFCNDDFPTAFRVSRRVFWWFLAGNIFLLFLFWTLTKIFAFCSKSFNMSETFSAVWPKFFDRHVRRAFYASIQTIRNHLSDIEKTQEQMENSSKTSKNFVTWEKKTSGQLFFDKDVEIATYVSI